MVQYRKIVPLLIVVLALILSACNLGAGNPAEETLQAATTTGGPTGLPTRTPATTSGAPTTLPLTTNPTRINQQFPPTAVVVIPATVRPLPTTVFVPVNIVILSPVPGNVVAGGITIFGSATHPNFLQYQVEYGPEPNPGNLWYPATAAVTTPVVNGVLGGWTTSSIPDGTYQLRLRVFLRDGTLLTTVVNNIRVQNFRPTPIPSATPLIERPIAAFNVNTSTGQVPLTVNFTNQSSGQINSIQWNFGDGTTSTEANPTHVFATPGLYTVTLTVSGPGGAANVSRQINAQSPSAPVAGFTLDRSSGVAPLTIQFTDQSTGTINAYSWNFLDGTGSAERNPAHTFNIPGTYNVLLTVSGPGGTSTAVRQITVTSPIPPTATWTWTPTTIPPTATFTPTWTPTTTTVPPTLTFTPTNTDVPPTATWTTTAVPPTSTEVPPDAQYIFAVDAVNPLMVQFFDQSTGPVTFWQWDFADGTTSNEQNPIHTYAAGGTYNVRLTVANFSGTPDFIDQAVTVAAPPTVTFTPTNTDVPPTSTEVPPDAQYIFAVDAVNPLMVQFFDQSTGPVTFWQWDFADGTTSNEQNPIHTYAAGGTYNVRLTVANFSGTPDFIDQAVTVAAPPTVTFTPTNTDVPPTSTEVPPDAQYIFAVDAVNPLMVQFFDQSSGPVTFWQWDFGDGTTTNEQNPIHTYAAGGTYNVRLTVANFSGTPDFIDQAVTVAAPPTATLEPTATPTELPPVANFTYAQPGTDVLTLQFTSQSTGNIGYYEWNFGDGSGVNEQNPIHTFPAPGVYNVRLIVAASADPSAPRGEITQQVTIQTPLDAVFTVAPVEGNPQALQFFDQSTGNVAFRQWDFGDGTSSNEQNPQHVYAAGGDFLVRLTVSDSVGASDAAEQPVSVAAPPTPTLEPTAEPTVEPTAEPTTGTPSIVMQTPVLPDLNQILANLGNIYNNGVAMGNSAQVFTLAGDDVFATRFSTGLPLLTPFGTAQFNLGENGDLQTVINWYTAITLADGTNTFVHEAQAIGTGWRSYSMLDPNNVNQSLCPGGTSVLACELQAVKPAIMIISVGANDALDPGRDMNLFRNDLQQIINTVVANGTIPVLMTTLPRTDGMVTQEQLIAINEQIVDAATANMIPLINVYRGLSELPNAGLNGDNVSPSVSPNGGGSLAVSDVSTYGVNALNLYILRTLEMLRSSLFPA